MTSYRYLGYGVTNSNGVAHLDHDPQGNPINGYTGTGAGEVDVIASTDNPVSSGSIVSETYSIIDASFIDTGLSDSTANVVLSRMSRQPTDNGAVITATGNNAWAIMKQNSPVFSNNCIIEFDLIANETPSTSVAIDLSTQGDAYQNKIYFEDLGHYKIQVTSESITALTGSQSISLKKAEYPPSDVRISFNLGQTGDTITYKDFVIYPI